MSSSSLTKDWPPPSSSSSSSSSESAEQGELYLPEHAMKVEDGADRQLQSRGAAEASSGKGAVEELIRRNFAAIKERVMGKLAAAGVAADALDGARHFLETVVRDVTVAAHGLTRDALLRIKSHLLDLFPSLSPALSTKMVDDAAKEVEAQGDTEQQSGNQMSRL